MNRRLTLTLMMLAVVMMLQAKEMPLVGNVINRQTISLNGDWWRESSSWQTRQNGSSAMTRVGARPAHPSLIRSATSTTL